MSFSQRVEPSSSPLLRESNLEEIGTERETQGLELEPHRGIADSLADESIWLMGSTGGK